MTKYSVIVPAYNAAVTLAKCLQALENQSVPKMEYEVIVVDDGSTDETPRVVEQFPVRYVGQKNQGPAAARNRGARIAKGEIILFTDADCVPQQAWLEEMVRPFDDPHVMAVKGAYKTHQRGFIARFAQIEFEERFEMLKKAASIDMVDTYSAGYRKSVFHSLGGFDPSFPVANNEDTDLSYRMSRATLTMVFNPAAVVYHLNHPDSIRKYARLKFGRGYWRMIVYRRYPDKMFKDTYTPQTLKIQIVSLFLALFCSPFLWLRSTIPLYPFLFSIALFALSALPFILFTLRKDLIIGAFSPLLISLRAGSLGLGIIWGVLSWIRRQ
jgi:glycosyltransferase involved in cell wall biosynthesis